MKKLTTIAAILFSISMSAQTDSTKLTAEKYIAGQKSKPRETQRIEVEDFSLSARSDSKLIYIFNLSKNVGQISKEKLSAIKQAIEQVLNNDPNSTTISDLFTQEQVDEICEQVFVAARKLKPPFREVNLNVVKFKSYQDYKIHKNN